MKELRKVSISESAVTGNKLPDEGIFFRDTANPYRQGMVLQYVDDNVIFGELVYMHRADAYRNTPYLWVKSSGADDNQEFAAVEKSLKWQKYGKSVVYAGTAVISSVLILLTIFSSMWFLLGFAVIGVAMWVLNALIDTTASVPKIDTKDSISLNYWYPQHRLFQIIDDHPKSSIITAVIQRRADSHANLTTDKEIQSDFEKCLRLLARSYAAEPDFDPDHIPLSTRHLDALMEKVDEKALMRIAREKRDGELTQAEKKAIEENEQEIINFRRDLELKSLEEDSETVLELALEHFDTETESE